MTQLPALSGDVIRPDTAQEHVQGQASGLRAWWKPLGYSAYIGLLAFGAHQDYLSQSLVALIIGIVLLSYFWID